jgi:hypothetical protein
MFRDGFYVNICTELLIDDIAFRSKLSLELEDIDYRL